MATLKTLGMPKKPQILCKSALPWENTQKIDLVNLGGGVGATCVKWVPFVKLALQHRNGALLGALKGSFQAFGTIKKANVLFRFFCIWGIQKQAFERHRPRCSQMLSLCNNCIWTPKSVGHDTCQKSTNKAVWGPKKGPFLCENANLTNGTRFTRPRRLGVEVRWRLK